MPVITISRTLGSEGTAIGKAVSKRLGYRYFDREELERVGRRHDYLRADLEVMDEQSLSLYDLLFRDKPKEYLAFLHDAICDAAEQGDVIIVGRGGQAILRDFTWAFHVRVDAPLEVRVSRIAKRLAESEARARKRIKAGDSERRRFVHQAFGVDPADHSNYHLWINTGKMDLNTAVKTVVQAFRQMRWREMRSEARDALRPYRLVKAIRAELIRHPGIVCPSCVDVHCDRQGTVTLQGRLTEPGDKGLIDSAVRKVKGVVRVINRLRA